MEFSAGKGFVEDSHTKQYVLGVASNWSKWFWEMTFVGVPSLIPTHFKLEL